MKLNLTRVGAAVVTAGLAASLGAVAPVPALADETPASSAAVETTAASETTAAGETAESKIVAKIGNATYASLDEALPLQIPGTPLSCNRTASLPRPIRFPRP